MIGCLYISDFPAWARQTQDPALRAIAVYNQGRIVARTRLLEQCRLQVGEALERARTMFPGACFFEQDYPFEHAVWEGVVHRVNEITPFLAPSGHGWAYLRPYSFSEACGLAGALMARLGLGPNRSIARLAAVRSAPGSVLQVKQSAVLRFLSSTRIDVLTMLGFDQSLLDRLRLFGMTSLAHLSDLSNKHLEAQFGADGKALFDLLHPNERSQQVPLYTPPPAIGESYDLDDAPLEWLPNNYLVEQLARRAMRRLGDRLCRRVSLQLAFREAPPLIRQRILKNPTANVAQVVRAASALLEPLMAEASEGTVLTLTISGLRNPAHRQASLFFERPPLSDAARNLDERFPGAIRRAMVVNPDAPFPEDAVRYSPFPI